VTYLAIVNGNPAALEVLLNAGADVHEHYAGNRSSGMTLLHYAVISEGLDKTLPLLIAKGAEKELKDSGEWSPLFIAINDTQIKGTMTREQRVSLLLNAGSDPNAMHLYSTPLIEAIIRAEKCVKPLLDVKADPNFRPPLGTFPIIYALGSEVSTEALGMLLEAGANPNVRGTPRDGNTGLSALDLAIDRRNKTKLELLLKHGADPNRRNARGETPLEHLQKDNGFRNAPRRRPGSLPPPGTLGPSGEIEPGQAASKESSIAELAEVLRKAGAREDLPDFNSIKVGRRSTAITVLLINRDPDGLNRITILEAIAMVIRKIGGLQPMRDFQSQATARALNSKQPQLYYYPEQLPWPDWQKVTISRPSSDGLSWSTIPVSPDVLLKAASCDDVPLLQWGDVVDIPEAVHELLPSPHDPSPPLWPAFTNCIYGGRITFITPGFTNTLGNGYDPQRSSRRPSGLMDWIGSTVLRSSSDVSRVTVRRAAFRGEPAWVRTFDLTFDSPEQVDLFLRDGDVIEVPDLIPATSGVTPAKARVFGALHGTLILPEGQVTRLSEIATRFGRNDAADLKNVKLYRTDPQSGYVDTIEADVEKILRTNDPAADLELRNGDRIEVPRK
jgi:ankyrin repeat protein